MRAWPRICAASGRPAPDLDEPCPCGAPQGMERLAVVGHMIDAGPGQAAAHEGRAGRVPSFTNGGWSRTNTSWASQSAGRARSTQRRRCLPALAALAAAAPAAWMSSAWTSWISS